MDNHITHPTEGEAFYGQETTTEYSDRMLLELMKAVEANTQCISDLEKNQEDLRQGNEVLLERIAKESLDSSLRPMEMKDLVKGQFVFWQGEGEFGEPAMYAGRVGDRMPYEGYFMLLDRGGVMKVASCKVLKK